MIADPQRSLIFDIIWNDETRLTDSPMLRCAILKIVEMPHSNLGQASRDRRSKDRNSQHCDGERRLAERQSHRPFPLVRTPQRVPAAQNRVVSAVNRRA
jgi:hypothetical protein